jgi:REP-associated tyrosine transposase
VEVPEFLTVEWILSQFENEFLRAVRKYKRFVRQGRGVAIWEELRRGNLLGTEAFVKQLEPLLNERIAAIEIPRYQRLAARPMLKDLFEGVDDKASRDEQIYQAVRVHDYTLKEVAKYVDLHYSTISAIAKRAAREKHQK